MDINQNHWQISKLLILKNKGGSSKHNWKSQN